MPNVNIETFIDLVRCMREAQKKWFRDRYPLDLGEAQYLERGVDHWLERESGPRAAPTLFDKKEG